MDCNYRIFALCLGLLIYFSEGLIYAQLGPFFPTNAIEEHRASTTWVGIITAVANVASFCGVWTFSKAITVHTQKHFFCLGATVSAASTFLFGVIGGWTTTTGSLYITLSVICR